MNKEELKKLYSAYFPYKLEVQHIDTDWPEDRETKTILTGVFEDCLTFNQGSDYYYNDEQIVIKPILWDLSYITKEIEHEGETFVPLEELLKLSVDETDNGEGCYSKDDIVETEVRNGFAISGIVNEHSKFTIRYYSKYQIFSLFHPLGTDIHLSYKYREKLIEWHFNVYNLPEDHFINKATLTNK